ncbi:MAG TPA: hypothetical protein VLW50_22435 [Streptosporangiaceae bacterium]|nr:hypothetical protein [Streptosporangiaceae bacterium]
MRDQSIRGRLMKGLAVDVAPQLWRLVVVIIAAGALAVGVRRLGRLAMAAEAERRARAREVAAAVAQYGLLFGFAAVAAGISAQGLTGFARDNMALCGPWPYLLFFALDGAAGLCAVLLLRRAARAESAIVPRVAVWGLVAASSAFNAAHAPGRPGARAAFALMPVIAAECVRNSVSGGDHSVTFRGPHGRLNPEEGQR